MLNRKCAEGSPTALARSFGGIWAIFLCLVALAMLAELHMLGLPRALSDPETTKKVVDLVGWLSTTIPSGCTMV
jgi:hypothetical protein